MIGQVLAGRYRIVEVLGTGSFGQTYVTEDTQRPGNPQCVLKHLKPARTDADFLPTARRLFNSEAETLEKLGNHDQIPRLLAYFEENKEFYLVQEFIEGHPLSSELPSGLQWTEEQVVRLLQEILSTLEFVHSQGVIHRDIKPDNLIRRNSDNKLVLIDFGAVKQIGQLSIHSQEPSNATIAIGTSGYLPTEQGQGKPRFNSDIYALGIIGLQALTGLGPHDLEEDNATGEIVWQHLISVSPGLAKVLTQMVRYHFKDRYQTATETLQALQTLSPVRQPKPVKNWKLIAGLGTGGLVAIALLLTLPNFLKPQSQPSPAPTQHSVSPTLSPSQPTASPRLKFDYSSLQAVLQQNPPNLKEADQATYKLMLEIAGPESKAQGRFDQTEWEQFSCSGLKEIDRLWREATQRNQGFSAQKEILDSVKGDPLAFQIQVGWSDESGKWLVKRKYNAERKTIDYDKEPNFENPPRGHLPAKLAWWDSKDHRFERIYDCKL